MALVLDTTQTSVATYTSSALNVSSYKELSIICNVTDIGWVGAASVTISTVDSSSNKFAIYNLPLDTGLKFASVGIGSTNNTSFGDSIIVDLTTIDSTTVTTTIYITGK